MISVLYATSFLVSDPVGQPDIWTDNVAHSVFSGAVMFKDDCLQAEACSLYRNFFVYLSSNFGIWSASKCAVEYDNVIIADTHIGVLNMVSDPPSTDHIVEYKDVKIKNSLFVGQSFGYDCALSHEPRRSLVRSRATGAAMGRATCIDEAEEDGETKCDGMVAIMFPTKISKDLLCPVKPFELAKSHMALGGLLTVSGKDVCL